MWVSKAWPIRVEEAWCFSIHCYSPHSNIHPLAPPSFAIVWRLEGAGCSSAFDQQGDPSPYKTIREPPGEPLNTNHHLCLNCRPLCGNRGLSDPQCLKQLVFWLPSFCGAFSISRPAFDVTCAIRTCSLPPNKEPQVSRIRSQVRVFVNVILTYKNVYAYGCIYAYVYT